MAPGAERRQHRALRHEADDNDAPPVVAVGYVAGGQHEKSL